MTHFEANTDPVGFDFVAAQRLIAEFLNAATALRGTAGARRTLANRALVDWRGRYAQQFAADVETGDTDAHRLAESYERAADQVRMLVRAAEAEDERRALARKWEDQQRKRSNLERIQDWIGLGDDDVPPPPPPAPQLNECVPSATSNRT
ncbi:MAG: hypothetical protein ABW000_26130 [Actinoplanes sp.]